MRKKKRFEKQNWDEKEYENIEKGVRIGKTIITLGGVFALGKKIVPDLLKSVKKISK